MTLTTVGLIRLQVLLHERHIVYRSINNPRRCALQLGHALDLLGVEFGQDKGPRIICRQRQPFVIPVFANEGTGFFRVELQLQPLVIGPPNPAHGKPARAPGGWGNAARWVGGRPPVPRVRKKQSLPLPVPRRTRPRWHVQR